MRNGLVVVVLALVAGCPDGGGGGGGATPCDALGECPPGLLCDPVSDTCVTPEAFDWCSLVTCPNGQVCDLTQYSGCRPATSCAEVTCDAGAGLHCDWYDFTCTRTPRCTYADECPSGHFCDTHRLCKEPGPGECLDTGDCQAGYACDLATHLCRGAVACASQAACPPGWSCVTDGRCELLAPGTCDAANDCAAGAACQAGLCVGCGTEGTICAGNFEGCDTGANRCVACTSSCALAGDACASPAPLALAEGLNVVSVDLHGYACDGADCAAGLADAWWSFTLAAPASVELGVAAEAYGVTAPRLELRSPGCGPRLAGHVFTSVAERRAMDLPAGTYALRFVGQVDVVTPHALLVTVTSRAAAQGSCALPRPFTLDYTGAGQVTYVSGSRHVSGDSCSEASWGAGAVLAIDLAQRSWLEVTLDTAPLNPYSLGLEIKDECLPEAPYACYAAPGVDTIVTSRGVGPGRQYVVVHGEGPEITATTIRAVAKPWPSSDLCATAPPMPAFVNDPWPIVSSTATGSTADDKALPDEPIQCPAGGAVYEGNDQFFSFSTGRDRSLAVTVTPDAPGTWTPVVSLEPGCGAADLLCGVGGAGTAATLARDILEPGQFVVHVASASGPGGPFTLKVTLGEPVYPEVLNDSCYAPDVPEVIELAGVGDSVTRTGDTRGGVGNGYPLCGWDTELGYYNPDVVYQLVMPPGAPRGRVTVTATPLSSHFDPVLMAQTVCPDPVGNLADLGCWNSSPIAVAETASVAVDGSAYVWVKGAGDSWVSIEGTQGPFELTATYEATAPANDRCVDAAAGTLTMPTVSTPAAVTGDLSVATATTGTCGGGLIDAFHVVTVASGGGPAAPVNLTLTPGGFTGRLRIFLDDCSNCYAATVTGTGVGAPVVLQVPSMRTGDVRRIGVSSADGKVGTYTLQAGPP